MSTKKKVKLDADDATERILSYMKAQNRPFSAKQVFDNLHGEIGQTQVQRSLDELADRGDVVRKENKKQKIYWISQSLVSNEGDSSEGNGTQMTRDEFEKHARELKEQATGKKNEADALERTNKKLNAEPGTEEGKAMVEKLRAEIAEMEKRLEELKGSGTQVKKEDVEKAEKKYNEARVAWKKRRRMCRDIVDLMGESSGKKFAEIAEMAGLETDEAYGITDIDDDETTRFRKQAMGMKK